MSYEGYRQILCTNGHQYNVDAYDDDDKCDCGADPYWERGVDETNGCQCYYTNGDEEKCGAHPLKLEILTPAEYETCLHCQHSKLTKEATYKVPEGKGYLVKDTFQGG